MRGIHLSACACCLCRGQALLYHCLPYTFETVNLEPPFLSKAGQSRSPREPPVSVYSSLWPLCGFGGSGLRSPYLHSRHYYSRSHLPRLFPFAMLGTESRISCTMGLSCGFEHTPQTMRILSLNMQISLLKHKGSPQREWG